MKKVFWFLIALIAIAVILFASYSFWLTTFTDRSVLTDLPCAAPCWQKIMPGVTTEKEALSILNENKYVDQQSIKIAGSSELGGVVWIWRVPYKRIQPSISWQDGIVNEITLGLSFDMAVKEVIDKFGPPEAVDIGMGGTPENWYSIVTLYYPEKGMEFKTYTKEYSNSFEPSTEVGAVIYFAPTTMNTRIVTEYQDSAQSVLDELHPWKGYGDTLTLYH